METVPMMRENKFSLLLQTGRLDCGQAVASIALYSVNMIKGHHSVYIFEYFIRSLYRDRNIRLYYDNTNVGSILLQ